MAKIHSDKFGVYVRANASIHRPGSSLSAVCAHYGLDLIDAVRDPFTPLTKVTRHEAGTSGVVVKNVRETPYVNVGEEFWVSDPFTSYSEWDKDRIPELIASARVYKRARLGERIAFGEEWRQASAEELEKLIASNKV